MPVPPPSPTVAFETVDVAMNSARAALNDCPLALSGNLLADTQPYAQQIYTDAWKKFQRDLAQYGEPACTEEFLSQSLPPVANIDPYTQVYLGQANYFDGQNFYSSPSVNLLPQDCIIPLHVEERLGGTTQLFTPMIPCDNGVPKGPKTTILRYWEWRSAGPGNGNAIFMPGATVARDIFVRYASYLPAAVTVGSIQWYQQYIPIINCSDILGLYIAAQFAFSRGSEQAKDAANSFWSEGKDQMRGYVNSTTMKIRQRINHRRRPYASQARASRSGFAWW